MPVSTRSQIISNQEQCSEQRVKPRQYQEKIDVGVPWRNQIQHHGLKEKMNVLTLIYDQQKNVSSTLKNPEEKRFCTHPSVDLHGSYKREDKSALTEKKNAKKTCQNVGNRSTMFTGLPEANPNSTNPTTFVFTESRTADGKENIVTEMNRVIGFSCPNKRSVSHTVARKLSLPQKNAQEMEKLETVMEKNYDLKRRILVFVRLRPLSKKEKDAGSRCCVRIVNRRDVYLTELAHENDYLRLKRLHGRHFAFDASFPDSASQHEVYSTTTADVVEAVLQGRNGSVFCYGATGAGKTYTMSGTVENPGVMVLAIKDLFRKIRQRSSDGNHVVDLSYLEVYNETVRDLLSPGRPLVLREDKQGIGAAGLTQHRAFSADEVMALLLRGNQNRTTEPTRANETSSRSHAILQVVVENKIVDACMNVLNRVGKLSLIDLAGSERALATDQRTLRSVEGANINRSLLALSSCINALVEGKKHIPYRNSKLTQLLKDSLGGGACNTIMIANISPSNLTFGDTQNTLHWADRAKEIRTKESLEEKQQVTETETTTTTTTATDQAKLILELQKENRELRMQLVRHQQKILTLKTQYLAANVSPTPSSVTSLLTPPSAIRQEDKKKTRASFLGRSCFSPGSKKTGAEESARELRQTVKALEEEIDGLKKGHSLQMKLKDDLISELSKKADQPRKGTRVELAEQVSRRSSLRPVKAEKGSVGLKNLRPRLKSPAASAKKRSFWDITSGTIPSDAQNRRKTRSHTFAENAIAAPPSLLLQPGFLRQKRAV